MDIKTLQGEFNDLKAKREAIQKKTEPLKKKREEFSLKAIEANNQANALTEEIQKINAAGDFMGLSRRMGVLADAIMAVKAVTKKD